MDTETKNKLIDGALVTAKATGMVAFSLALSGMTGGRGGIFPRPINMWKNQRRTRAFKDAVEASGAPLTFQVRVTFKGKQPKVSSLTWAALNVGCDKWELAYYLVTDGSCSWGKNGAITTEIVWPETGE
jgi:hypothetical protein